jgi:hypothetical protein
MTRKLGAVAVVTALLLTACTGSGDSMGGGSGPSSGSGAGGTTGGGPTPYLPVPDGVTLTDPGSELGVGETAVIAWRPQGEKVGVLKLTVRRLEHADLTDLAEWQLDAAARTSSLYYVSVSVKNVGAQDLGGTDIPLFVLDGANTLVRASTFKTGFTPCPSTPLPDTFAPGDQTRTCLAYLVPRHGKLVAASFRPSDTFNPITWVGKVVEPKQPKKKPSKG